MSPYLLLLVLTIAASVTGETTPKTKIDITTRRPGIQPLPAKLPGSPTPPVRNTRQIVTTPKSQPLTDSPKSVPTTTLKDLTATPTFPRRRRDTEDEDEDGKTLPGIQRPLFGGALGQLFANRPNLGLQNLFGNRRPVLADQGISDLTIQSEAVPAAGLQTFGATQTVALSNQPEELTAAHTTSQLASQTATLTGSQSTAQPTSPSSTVTTTRFSEATLATTHSNDEKTTQPTTELSRKTRDVEAESSFPKPKGDSNEDGFKPSTTWTTASTEFKPYTLIANLKTTEKPTGIFSQSSIAGKSGSASAFAGASSTSSEEETHATNTQNKDNFGQGWSNIPTTARPFKRDSFQQREKRSPDVSTQKPQTGSGNSGSAKPLATSTIKPRTPQTTSKSTQKIGGVPSTTPKSRVTYPTRSPVRPLRSAVTDSPQKTNKNSPTPTTPSSKHGVTKTTPRPTTAPKRPARDTKSGASTTQKPQTVNKKVSN